MSSSNQLYVPVEMYARDTHRPPFHSPPGALFPAQCTSLPDTRDAELNDSASRGPSLPAKPLCHSKAVVGALLIGRCLNQGPASRGNSGPSVCAPASGSFASRAGPARCPLQNRGRACPSPPRGAAAPPTAGPEEPLFCALLYLSFKVRREYISHEVDGHSNLSVI